MTFAELLALAQNPGEDGAPDDIWDQLSGAHASELDGANAALGEKDSALAAALAEIQALKAHNYELLMAVGSDSEEDDSDDSDDSENDDDDTRDGDSDAGVDDGWTVKEDS